MQNFAIVSKQKKNAVIMVKTARRLGFAESKSPEFIICIGGDGTFLRAEQKYPSVPKLLIKDSDVCHKCDNLEYDSTFMSIAKGHYTLQKHMKLEATLEREKMLAANEINVRNRLPIHAIRFSVTIGKDIYPLIGDGVVVSTPFGSTGYYYSIAKKKFARGIGIAFNNVTERVVHRVVNDKELVKIRLLRHDADLTVDNDPKILTLREGQELVVRASKECAKIVVVTEDKSHLPFRHPRTK